MHGSPRMLTLLLSSKRSYLGSTAVFAIIVKDNKNAEKPWRVIVGNLGDSRLLVGHYDDEGVQQISRDHKPMVRFRTIILLYIHSDLCLLSKSRRRPASKRRVALWLEVESTLAWPSLVPLAMAVIRPIRTLNPNNKRYFIVPFAFGCLPHLLLGLA